MARPRKVIDLDELSKLCELACTDKEIASFFEVSVDLIRRRNHEVKFSEAKARGSARGRTSLRRLQWRAAEKGNVGILIWLGKNLLGQMDQPPGEEKSGREIALECRAAMDEINASIEGPPDEDELKCMP
jgi:hypothetical protein